MGYVNKFKSAGIPTMHSLLHKVTPNHYGLTYKSKKEMKRKFYKIMLAASLLLLSSGAYAQILHPVKWSYAAKRISKTEAVIFLKATIDDGWHLYSQTVKEGGPVKTSFNFNSSEAYEILGNTIEPAPITKFEKVFGMDVSYFASTVVFQQKVKMKKSAVIVSGTLNYMTCNDRQCLPPEDVAFSIPIK